jgi:hypothetical protein
MRALTLLATLTLGANASVIHPLDHVAIQEALTIANSSIESTHRRFHGDYHLPVKTPPVDFVSIVTPFRRVVLSAETEFRQGRRMFGQREALAALEPDPDRFEVYAELTLHPLNTFIGLPEYTIELEPISFRGPAVVAFGIDRLPRFGPRFESSWYPFPYPYSVGSTVAGGQPLVGGTLIARFAARELDRKGIYAVIVKDGGKDLGRAKLDLARVR